MAVFDRSWYGRVLVERVEGFATKEQWQRAYGEIVEFEPTLAAEGMILVKFWMHVSPEEQLRRFEAAQARPAASRGSSPTRTGATGRSARRTRLRVEDMLARTDQPRAVVRRSGDDKRYARVAVVEHVSHTIEKQLTKRGYDIKDADR